MNIPKFLWELICRYIFTDSCRTFLTSDFMFNIYMFVVVLALGYGWRRGAWVRRLTELFDEYYNWVEVNVPLPGHIKLRRYLEKLNEAIIELRGTPMTDEEIKMAKLTADTLAQKDHLARFYE
ncbi:MAG: hypothetical protein GX855_05220 [Firmicutes bacterium]|nr:hypothetical protein [Bacillota bacterium]